MYTYLDFYSILEEAKNFLRKYAILVGLKSSRNFAKMEVTHMRDCIPSAYHALKEQSWYTGGTKEATYCDVMSSLMASPCRNS